MSKKKDSQKAPNLRFKGFTDDWEQRKLSDSLRVLDGDRGTNYPHESDFFQSGDTLFLNTSNVTKNGFNFNTVKYITKEKDELLHAGRLEENDFVLTSRGTLGNVSFYDHKTYTDYPKVRINSAMLILRNVDKQLSYSYLHSVLKGKLISDFMKKNQVGSAQPHITKTEFLKLNLSIPENIKEQEKIGNFLNELESTITLRQRKLDELNQLKAALLQQMFPGKGETVPKLRFAGFEGDWEERKMGEIAPLRGGFAFKSSEFQEEGIPIVRISNILTTGEVGGDFIYYPEQVKDDNYLLPDRSVVLAMSGATTGKVSILSNPNDEKVYQNQRVGYFTKTKIADYGFISTITQSQIFIEQLRAMLVAGAQPNISSKDIDMMDFTVSKNLEEQTKIGAFFQGFDNLITLQQRKLDQLQNMKQVLLQNMFI